MIILFNFFNFHLKRLAQTQNIISDLIQFWKTIKYEGMGVGNQLGEFLGVAEYTIDGSEVGWFVGWQVGFLFGMQTGCDDGTPVGFK